MSKKSEPSRCFFLPSWKLTTNFDLPIFCFTLYTFFPSSSSTSSFVSFLDSLCFSILSTNFLPSFVLPSNKFFFFFFFFLTTTTELSSPVPATDGPVAFAGASSPIGRPVYGFTSSNLLTIKFLLMHLL